ncbi:MAG: EFR1 family ferrodoxin [Lachnospiraceae bacterium]|nr:EFR1 family ferrodoxin [Lachnospiraceae bacterium]
MANTVQLYYFSPTGGTKKAGTAFCEAVCKDYKMINLAEKTDCVEQPSADLVVFAAPVYAGRIPEFVTEKMKKLDGTGKKAVTLAVYGVRAYEDALLEMNDVAKACGFEVIASGAFIAQHSIVPEVGAGRPDARDIDEIQDFAKKVSEKQGEVHSEFAVPGNRPYRDGNKVSATPISLDDCTYCGICAEVCPTDAITVSEDTAVTELSKCMMCMACVAHCPNHARVLPAPMQQALNEKLGVLKDVRRENETFM